MWTSSWRWPGAGARDPYYSRDFDARLVAPTRGRWSRTWCRWTALLATAPNMRGAGAATDRHRRRQNWPRSRIRQGRARRAAMIPASSRGCATRGGLVLEDRALPGGDFVTMSVTWRGHLADSPGDGALSRRSIRRLANGRLMRARTRRPIWIRTSERSIGFRTVRRERWLLPEAASGWRTLMVRFGESGVAGITTRASWLS